VAFVMVQVTLGRSFLSVFQYYSTSAQFAALLNKAFLTVSYQLLIRLRTLSR
jgi:hypothetical protein